MGDLGFVGIADDPGDAGECGKFFGGALGVAAGDNETDGGVGGMKLSNGVARLGIGGSRDGAGVEDDDVSGGGRGGGGAATVKQLALEGGAIGLSGAAAELFDEESGHLRLQQQFEKDFTQSSRSTPRPCPRAARERPA